MQEEQGFDSFAERQRAMFKKYKSKCFVSNKAALGCIFLFIFLFVLVILTVYFTHPALKELERIKSNLGAGARWLSQSPVVRLPESITPAHYNVHLRPDIYTGNNTTFVFNGSVIIRVNCAQTTYTVTLHSSGLVIDKDSVSVRRVTDQYKIPVTNVYLQPEQQLLFISLREKLVGNNQYDVRINFKGKLSNEVQGMFYTSYISRNGETEYAVGSMLEPVSGRRVLPCFDEPSWKSTFNLTVDRRDGYLSKSNTEIWSVETLENGWYSDHYHRTPKMSVYLLAVLVSKFQCLETSTSSGTKIEVCARPNALDQARYANGLVNRMQNYLGGYCNISYPISKMSHVALPDYGTAMENWGLIMYRESNMLLDQTTTSEYAKQRMTQWMAHELAHQWFGNLVTARWWSDIWLNEGFAIWMEILILKETNPDWDMEGQFVAERLQPALNFDGLRSSDPVYREVLNNDDINNLFDVITYIKSGSVIRMMMKVLGDTVFQRGLQTYLKKNSYQAVGHMELFDTLSNEAHMRGSAVSITDVFLPWILQQGYPVIKAVYSSSTGRVQLTQKPFLYERYSAHDDDSQVWQVPITVVTDMDLTWDNVPLQWLTDRSGSVNTTTNARWILLNIGQSFLYRVNYETEVWEGLINQLNQDHYKLYNKENRAQIIDDLFNLARVGEVDPSMGLRAMEYIDKETELTPWLSTLRNVEYIDDMLKLTTAYPYLKNYMLQKIERQYSRLGWTTSDTHTKQHMRGRILDASCYFGLQDCLDKAVGLFKGWMEYPSSLKDKPNLQKVVFCNGIREGSSTAWTFLYEKYRLSNSATEQETMLKSLACTTHAHLLISFMHRAMNGEVRHQYFGTIIEEIARNRNGPSVAWNFLKSNWDLLYNKHGVFFIHYVASVAKHFSTQWQFDDLNNFLSKTMHFEVEPQELTRALESVRINLQWKEKREDAVTAWLKNKTS